ncbi:MAG: peptide chain release factor 1 [Eubacteriaceae bacterium]|jgi:peptide chain release factor 1|nr:peptide chain release factor 1 [Eubacteriaceae bacterium]
MLERLAGIKEKYEDLNRELEDPDAASNQQRYASLMKERSAMEGIVEKYDEYASVLAQLSDNKALIEEVDDEAFHQMILEDIASLTDNRARLEDELKVLLLPKDPNDEKNVMVEIRAGVGGEEAALFSGSLLRMYARYAERRHWKAEILSSNETGIGGYKEAVLMISGKGAYSRLKYERGTHRVQRVPETESQGRIHTSAATVAILPEAEGVEVEINSSDLRIDVFRSSGNGGQSVNTTDSAVRVTHLPTGIVISCQDEKSQLKNKDKALKILKAKLYEIERKRQEDAIAQNRKSQVGSGDRSERIRTYNFPQGRVTDHRVNLTLYKLESVLDGDIDEFIDTLITTDQAEKIAQSES